MKKIWFKDAVLNFNHEKILSQEGPVDLKFDMKKVYSPGKSTYEKPLDPKVKIINFIDEKMSISRNTHLQSSAREKGEIHLRKAWIFWKAKKNLASCNRLKWLRNYVYIAINF